MLWGGALVDAMLIPSGVIAFISILATAVMLLKRHYENAFTRFCVSLFYLALTFMPVDIEVARILNRWFWVLVLGTEVFWWCVMAFIKWRSKQ